jgi:N-acetyl-1-D-myo-inositol-2-amino-2-deoxy-alpha-D-glucopyranoside deacetylase
MAELGLLGVFAHPDDEQLMSGVYAQAAADGVKTGLICATRGELGEIASPELATPENLGHVRENELRAACAVLGIKYLWFLDYRDSGMMGTIGNDDPAAFYRSDQDEAVGRVVKIVREFKPSVMVTFDPTGGYGHPDHITICKVATEAFHAAGDESRYPEAGAAWKPSRLFYAGFPRGQMKRFGEVLQEMGVENFLGMVDREQYGLADDSVTHAVTVEQWLSVKERSLFHHRTQNNPESIFSKMPKEWIDTLRSTEHYALVAGTPVPEAAEAKQDLFAGLKSA